MTNFGHSIALLTQPYVRSSSFKVPEVMVGNLMKFFLHLAL